jgi:Domain of unknown function (DUF1902)
MAMTDEQPITVHATWDDEAGVFVATSDDVPGLVAEAADMAALHEKLTVLIPELLDLNASVHAGLGRREVPLLVEWRQRSMIRLGA